MRFQSDNEISCIAKAHSACDKVLRIVTFRNAQDLQETAKNIPLDRLLVETDSPFLAPVPNRGKTCEPAFVADTAAFLSDLRHEPLDELAQATTANFFKLFNKAAA